MKAVVMDNANNMVEFAKDMYNETFYESRGTIYSQHYLPDLRSSTNPTHCFISAAGTGNTTGRITKYFQDSTHGLNIQSQQYITLINNSGGNRHVYMFMSGGYYYIVFWSNVSGSMVFDVFRRYYNDYDTNFSLYVSRSSTWTKTPHVFYAFDGKVYAYSLGGISPSIFNYYNISDNVSGYISGAGQYGCFCCDSNSKYFYYLSESSLYKLNGSTVEKGYPIGFSLHHQPPFRYYYGLGIVHGIGPIIKVIANCKPLGRDDGLYCFWIINSTDYPNNKITFYKPPIIKLVNDFVILPPILNGTMYDSNFENHLVPCFSKDFKKVYWISQYSNSFYYLENKSDINLSLDNFVYLCFHDYIYISGKYLTSGASNKIYRIKSPQNSKTESFKGEGTINYAMNSYKFDLFAEFPFKGGYIYPLYDDSDNFLTFTIVNQRKNKQNGWIYEMLIPSRYNLNMNLLKGIVLYTTSVSSLLQFQFLYYACMMNPYIEQAINYFISEESVNISDFTSGYNIMKIYQNQTGRFIRFRNHYEDIYEDSDSSSGSFTITDHLNEIDLPEDGVQIQERVVSKYILYGSNASIKVIKETGYIGLAMELSYPWVSSIKNLQKIADNLSNIYQVIKIRFASKIHQFHAQCYYNFYAQNPDQDIRLKILPVDSSNIYSQDQYCIEEKYDFATGMNHYKFVNTLYSDLFTYKSEKFELNDERQGFNNYRSEGLKFYHYLNNKSYQYDHVFYTSTTENTRVRYILDNNGISKIVTMGSLTYDDDNLGNVYIPSDATAVMFYIAIKFYSTGQYATFYRGYDPRFNFVMYNTGVVGSYVSQNIIIPLYELIGIKFFDIEFNVSGARQEVYISFRGWFM